MLIKLISTLNTGYARYLSRPRATPVVKQIRYDPLVRRHVLFVESKKRKHIPEVKPLVWTRGHPVKK